MQDPWNKNKKGKKKASEKTEQGHKICFLFVLFCVVPIMPIGLLLLHCLYLESCILDLVPCTLYLVDFLLLPLVSFNSSHFYRIPFSLQYW